MSLVAMGIGTAAYSYGPGIVAAGFGVWLLTSGRGRIASIAGIGLMALGVAEVILVWRWFEADCPDASGTCGGLDIPVAAVWFGSVIASVGVLLARLGTLSIGLFAPHRRP